MVGDERVSWAGAMTNPCRSDRFPRSASRSLLPARAAIATAPEPVAALEDADAAFAPGAPAQRLAEPAVARRRGLRVGRRAPGLAGQHDFVHAELGGEALVVPRGKPAIGHGQPGRPAEQLLMSRQGGLPQLLVRHSPRADLVIRDESRF